MSAARSRSTTTRRYRVLTAPGGYEALPLLERDIVHVVLTDLKMRRMDGLDVLRAAHAVDPNIAVIMMTRFASIASAVEAMRCGANDYLTKPVNLHELEVVIQRAVAQLVRRRRCGVRPLASPHWPIISCLTSRYR